MVTIVHSDILVWCWSNFDFKFTASQHTAHRCLGISNPQFPLVSAGSPLSSPSTLGRGYCGPICHQGATSGAPTTDPHGLPCKQGPLSFWYDWTQHQLGIEPIKPLGQCWLPPIVFSKISRGYWGPISHQGVPLGNSTPDPQGVSIWSHLLNTFTYSFPQRWL